MFRGAVGRHRSSFVFDRRPSRLLLLVLVVAIAGSCDSTRSAPRSASRLNLGQTLDSALDDARDRLGIPGVQAAIVFGDGRTWAGKSGVIDLEERSDVTDESLFGIGSVTKPLMAALILDLQEDGLLDIDDPVVRWLPGLHVARKMTLRHLMSHTSGLAELDPTAQPFEKAWVEWRTRATEALTPKTVCPPGRCWSYSNVNYVALGLIAERAGSDSVQQQLEKRFLARLRLDDVFLEGDVRAPRHLVAGYEHELGGPKEVSHRSFAAGAWTAGGITATASDTAALFAGLFGGHILSKSSLAQITDVSVSDRPDAVECHPYGLGLEMGTSTGGERTWTHSGHLPGYRSEMTYFPDSDVTVVVMANLSGRFPMEVSNGLVNVLRERGLITRGERAPCNTDLYSIATRGQEDRITHHPAVDGSTITGDPSGSEIIFTSTRAGNPQLFRLDLRSGAATQVTANSGPNGMASWSPDGEQVVYSDASDGDDEIILLDLQSGERTQLTDNSVPDSMPTWSPAGHAIAFSRGTWGLRDVWMLDLETDTEARLTSAIADEWWPTWSPRGDEIAYMNDSDGAIDVIGVEHSGYRRLTSDGVDAFPSWGPTGRIAFLRDGDVWTMGPEGGTRRRITRSEYSEFAPSWSSNGKTIFFPAERPVSTRR